MLRAEPTPTCIPTRTVGYSHARPFPSPSDCSRGFLVREGMRESEALSLTWECVDLKRGAIRLDKNKTDDPRSWALDAGVARALRVYRKCFPSDASASGLVFVSPNGEAISKLGLAELLRGSPRDRVREPRLFHGMCRKLELQIALSAA